MPLYEYRCKSCGQVIEVIQKFGDKPLKKCRECSGPLEKLISRSSFQLKGGGWYASNYSPSKSSETSSDSASTASSSTGDGGPKPSDPPKAAGSKPADPPKTASTAAAEPKTGCCAGGCAHG